MLYVHQNYKIILRLRSTQISHNQSRSHHKSHYRLGGAPNSKKNESEKYTRWIHESIWIRRQGDKSMPTKEGDMACFLDHVYDQLIQQISRNNYDGKINLPLPKTTTSVLSTYFTSSGFPKCEVVFFSDAIWHCVTRLGSLSQKLTFPWFETAHSMGVVSHWVTWQTNRELDTRNGQTVFTIFCFQKMFKNYKIGTKMFYYVCTTLQVMFCFEK